MILFGAGRLGRRILVECRLRGLKVDAFADNDPQKWNDSIDGLPVLSPDDAQAAYPNAIYVVTIYNGKSTRIQLREMGLSVTSAPNFLLRFDIRLVDFGYEPTSYYHLPEVVHSVGRLLSRLHDVKSREELLAQINWRSNGMENDSLLPPHDSDMEMYFPPFLKPNPEEVFFDCGAYDGDTIRQFQTWSSSYASIWGFEPVRHVRATKDVKVIRVGVSDTFSYTCFTDEGPGSHAGAGDIPGMMMPLNWLYPLHPTLIKMDIEGSEPKAIEGASEIIRDFAPAMAVCLYHKASHLWEVPLALHALNPSYKLLIRRYADDGAELICYAIPEDRLAL